MKFLLTLSVLGAFCTDSASSYISSISPGGAIPWKKTSFAQPPSDVEVDDVFRQEYHAWAHRYGKSTTDKFRFENFKLNYMLQMQQNKRTGSFADLNEFGDMTVEEFESATIGDNTDTNNFDKTAEVATTSARKDPSEDNVVEVELVDGPVPTVRPFGSGTIPRKTQFADTRPQSPPNYSNPEYRQRPKKVNVDWSPSRERQPSTRPEKVNVDWSPSKPREQFSNRETKYTRYRRPLDPSEPRVYRQDQPTPFSPRRKRRLVRVGPDAIL